MRRFVLVLAAAALLFGAPGEQAVAGPAITISNTTGLPLGNPPFTLGWDFDVEVTILVSALGVFDDSQDGLVDSYPIGIWDSSGNLLASTTVASGTADPLINQFRYHAITPIILAVGQSYSIGALYTTGNDPLIFPGFATGFATDPSITFVSNSFTSGGTLSDPTFQGGPVPAYFGPNFILNQVPEPATLTLLGIALAGLGFSRRRKAN